MNRTTAAPVLFVLALLTARPSAADQPVKAPLTAAERAIFYGSPEDVLDKPTCLPGGARVTRSCRDAKSYVHMNEWHHEVYRPYIQGIGGGYLGIASDQAFTFIAWARSELAWMMDYDPVVVAINRAHRALILHSADIDQYLQRFTAAGSAEALALIEKEYAGHPDRDQIVGAFRALHADVGEHLRHVRGMGQGRPFHWLHDQKDYDYVRAMFQADRIRILKGDLLKGGTVAGIAEAARQLKVPVRVIYLSNAEEFWPYPQPLRKSFAALPMDEQTVVLRTRHSPKYGPPIDSYIYVVQGGLDFQRALQDPRATGVWSMLERRKAGAPGFFTIGIPVRQPN